MILLDATRIGRNEASATLSAHFDHIRGEGEAGEQRKNTPGECFFKAKSSPQGDEGRSYAPTRIDYVAGQEGDRLRGNRSVRGAEPGQGRSNGPDHFLASLGRRVACGNTAPLTGRGSHQGRFYIEKRAYIAVRPWWLPLLGSNQRQPD